MPRAEDLPAPLAATVTRQAATLDHAEFHADVERLCDRLAPLDRTASRGVGGRPRRAWPSTAGVVLLLAAAVGGYTWFSGQAAERRRVAAEDAARRSGRAGWRRFSKRPPISGSGASSATRSRRSRRRWRLDPAAADARITAGRRGHAVAARGAGRREHQDLRRGPEARAGHRGPRAARLHGLAARGPDRPPGMGHVSLVARRRPDPAARGSLPRSAGDRRRQPVRQRDAGALDPVARRRRGRGGAAVRARPSGVVARWMSCGRFNGPPTGTIRASGRRWRPCGWPTRCGATASG